MFPANNNAVVQQTQNNQDALQVEEALEKGQNPIDKILFKREHEDYKSLIKSVFHVLLSSVTPSDEEELKNYQEALQKALDGEFSDKKMSPALQKMLVNVYYWVKNPQDLMPKCKKESEKSKKLKLEETKEVISEVIKARIILLENIHSKIRQTIKLKIETKEISDEEDSSEYVKQLNWYAGKKSENAKFDNFPFLRPDTNKNVKLCVSTIFIANLQFARDARTMMINDALQEKNNLKAL